MYFAVATGAFGQMRFWMVRTLIGGCRQCCAAQVAGRPDVDRRTEFAPLAFLIASAAFVRSEMSRRSFSARAMPVVRGSRLRAGPHHSARKQARRLLLCG